MTGSRGDRAIGISIVVFTIGFGLASRLIPDSSAKQASAQQPAASSAPTATSPVSNVADAPAATPVEAAPVAPTPGEPTPAQPATKPDEVRAEDIAPERFPAEFYVGSAEPRNTDRDRLRALAARFERCPGTIEITGHTDASGDSTENTQLSLARAEAVRDALAKRLPSKEFAVVGAGGTEPIAANDTQQGRRANRRATIACR